MFFLFRVIQLLLTIIEQQRWSFSLKYNFYFVKKSYIRCRSGRVSSNVSSNLKVGIKYSHCKNNNIQSIDIQNLRFRNHLYEQNYSKYLYDKFEKDTY